jgi:hypothetical protein
MDGIELQCPECGEPVVIPLPPRRETSLCRVCKRSFDFSGEGGSVAVRVSGRRLTRQQILRLLDAREREGDAEVIRSFRERLGALPDDAFASEQE